MGIGFCTPFCQAECNILLYHTHCTVRGSLDPLPNLVMIIMLPMIDKSLSPRLYSTYDHVLYCARASDEAESLHSSLAVCK